MADLTANIFYANLMKKEVDLEADVLKLALMTSSYTPDKDTDTFVNTYEISGAGYTAGGATLTGKSVTQDNASDKAVFDANDISADWTSNITAARYMVLYDTTVSDMIIAVFDLSSDKVVTSVTWDADGIFDLSQGA